MEEKIIADKNSLDSLYQDLAKKIEVRPVKVSVSSLKKKTNKQLGYYWATVVPTITKELNERGLASAMLTEADINEVLNRKFFNKKVNINGEIQTFASAVLAYDWEQTVGISGTEDQTFRVCSIEYDTNFERRALENTKHYVSATATLDLVLSHFTSDEYGEGYMFVNFAVYINILRY